MLHLHIMAVANLRLVPKLHHDARLTPPSYGWPVQG